MGLFSELKRNIVPSRDRPLLVPPSSLKFSDDILLVIFSHLSPADLFNCLLAGRQALYAAEKTLYSTSEVTYGREWERVVTNRWGRSIMRRNVFQGLSKPSSPVDWSDPSTRLRPFEPSLPPFQPSSMKMEKLQLVRRFTYYSHPPDQCDYISKPSLLPSLDTLTIVSHRPNRLSDETPAVGWATPLVSHLRPRHLRLLHIPSIQRKPGVSYPLAVFGSGVERLTLHFLNCLSPSYSHLSRSDEVGPVDIIDVDWPAGMKRLDLVFMQADKRKDEAVEPTFYGKRSAVISARYIKEAATAVARLIASAVGRGERKDLVVRIVGLGFDFENESSEAYFAREVGIYLSRDEFSRQLEEVYREQLKRNGMKADEAETWVEKLDLVDRFYYLYEEDDTNPPKHRGIEGGKYMDSKRAFKYARLD